MNNDLERLQGNWNIVSLEMGGRKMPLLGGKISVKGDRFITTGMGATYEGKVEVGAIKKLKPIDLIFDSGPEQGTTALGIFEFEDDDTWKLCLTTQGGKRPEAFATEPGTGHAFEVLKREGAADSRPAEPASAQAPDLPLPDAAHIEPLQGEWSMVSGSMDGQPFEKSLVKVGKRITTGNETSVLFGPQVYTKAKFTVDPAKAPKTIDLLHSHGGAQGQMQYGIYEIDGNTLRLALGSPGQDRPTDYSARPGAGHTVVTWKRLA
jgi:uncharacterized protein (TIGR03067 family)